MSVGGTIQEEHSLLTVSRTFPLEIPRKLGGITRLGVEIVESVEDLSWCKDLIDSGAAEASLKGRDCRSNQGCLVCELARPDK